MPQIDFWYEFASTYSYPAAMRIEALAAARGVAVRWRPFLLGPLFVEQGWRDSPFNIYPVKGRYMWRDLAAHLRGAGSAAAPPGAVSAKHAARGARRPGARCSRPRALQPRRLRRRIRRGSGDRRPRGASPNSPGVTRRLLARARIAGEQGGAEGRLRGGQGAWPARRAVLRDRRRRSVLGQRPARTGARLGVEILTPRRQAPTAPPWPSPVKGEGTRRFPPVS